MNKTDLIKGNLKSKTSWIGILLIALGAIEQGGVLELVPDEYKGAVMSIVGALMLVLRNITTTSVLAKAQGDSSAEG